MLPADARAMSKVSAQGKSFAHNWIDAMTPVRAEVRAAIFLVQLAQTEYLRNPASRDIRYSVGGGQSCAFLCVESVVAGRTGHSPLTDPVGSRGTYYSNAMSVLNTRYSLL
jgi:hypothetical protein